MLPRVSQVLKKFLSPIAEIAQSAKVQSGVVREQLLSQEKRDDQQNHDSGNEPELAQGQEENASESTLPPSREKPRLSLVENTPPPPPTLEDMPAILQLFARLKEQRELMFKWAGIKSYKRSAREQSKSAHFAKGTILDEKIS